MDVMIPARGVELPADVVLPPGTGAAVVFVHGSGSSRHSPRNRYVAGALQAAGLATVLVDLLTPAEEREDERAHALRFDIHMLAERTAAIVDGPSTGWRRSHRPPHQPPALTPVLTSRCRAARTPADAPV